MINFNESDIDTELATRAHQGTSWEPEIRAKQYVRYYMEHMAEVDKEFSGYATEENRAAIEIDLEKYRAKYITLLNAMLYSKSNCISSFITGPSGFPVNKAQKANDRAHKHTGKWLDYQEWKLTKLRRLHNPRMLANAPIRSDDIDAVEKLEKKIIRLKRNQETMKAANKIIRSKKLTDEQKIDNLINDLGFDEDPACKLMSGGYWGKGFAGFSLTNNNANIKRLEGRLAQIMREHGREKPDEYNAPEGVEVVENTDETRIQLIFDGKPSADIRTILKGSGFRWSPTQGAWQRLLNANGRQAAKYVVSKIGAN